MPWRDSSAIAHEVVDLVSDPVRYRAMCARAAAHGREMTWPAVARQYVESFSRARANDTRRRRSVVPGADAGQSPCRLAGDRPPARPRADRRHRDPPARDLQHSALRGRVLPGRQRASPAVDDAPRRGGHRRPGGRARARVTLSGVREPRVRPIVGTLPELSLVRAAMARAAWVGRQSWPSALGARRSRGPGERSGPAQSCRRPLSCGTAGRDHVYQPPGVGLRAARHRGVSAGVSGRQHASKRCARIWRPACSASFSGPARTIGRGSRTPSRTATRDCHKP